MDALQQAAPLVSLGSSLTTDDSVFLFSDALAFVLAGVPAIDLKQNSPAFPCAHHSSADTFDKVSADVLTRNATTLALLAFWIADRPTKLGVRWSPDETAQMLKAQKVADFLRGVGV